MTGKKLLEAFNSGILSDEEKTAIRHAIEKTVKQKPSCDGLLFWCPTCQRNVGRWQHNCEMCGQALKWGK